MKLLLILIFLTTTILANTCDISYIQQREGIKHYSYYDSQGILTAGYGHVMTTKDRNDYPKGVYIPMRQVQQWLKHDLHKAEQFSKQAIKRMHLKYTFELHTAITAMYYQLGGNGAKAFVKFEEAMRTSDFNQAVKELEDSKWFKQTPKRVVDLIANIRIYQHSNPPFIGGA